MKDGPVPEDPDPGSRVAHRGGGKVLTHMGSPPQGPLAPTTTKTSLKTFLFYERKIQLLAVRRSTADELWIHSTRRRARWPKSENPNQQKHQRRTSSKANARGGQPRHHQGKSDSRLTTKTKPTVRNGSMVSASDVEATNMLCQNARCQSQPLAHHATTTATPSTPATKPWHAISKPKNRWTTWQVNTT